MVNRFGEAARRRREALERRKITESADRSEGEGIGAWRTASGITSRRSRLSRMVCITLGFVGMLDAPRSLAHDIRMFRPPEDRRPIDIRDEEEKADVARVLAILPANHPARVAHERGTDTIPLSHLVGNPALSAALTDAFLAGRNRIFQRSTHFRP